MRSSQCESDVNEKLWVVIINDVAEFACTLPHVIHDLPPKALLDLPTLHLPARPNNLGLNDGDGSSATASPLATTISIFVRVSQINTSLGGELEMTLVISSSNLIQIEHVQFKS